MTEIHFNNPDKIEGLQIHAGMEMYYTSELRYIPNWEIRPGFTDYFALYREHDAGFLQIGSVTSKAYSLTVPPMSSDFVFSSHCQADCTQYIPDEGVNVFVYLLHSHLNGK